MAIKIHSGNGCRKKNVQEILPWMRINYEKTKRIERLEWIQENLKVNYQMSVNYHKDVRDIIFKENKLFEEAGKVLIATDGNGVFCPINEIKLNFEFLLMVSKGEYEAKHKNRSAKELVRMNTHFNGVIRVMDDIKLDDRIFGILAKIADRLKIPCDRKSLQPDIDRLKVDQQLWLPFDESFEFDPSINECLGVFVKSRNEARCWQDRISAVEMMNRVLENPKFRIHTVDEDMIGSTALRRMNAIFGLKEWDTPDCLDMKLGGFWRPFQKRWIQDRSRLKIVEKSRRTGYTFGSSFGWSLEALEYPDDCGIWISRSEKLAKQFSKDYLLGWARIINFAVETDYINFRNITAGQADYPNGHKIIMASSNPDAVAGFGGKIGLDEYALNPYAERLYDIAVPAIMYGHRLEVISTHRGRGQFYHFVQEAKEKDSDWSYHRANIKDAIADGIVQVVNNAKQKAGQKQLTDQQFYDEVRNSCRSEESFLQEYMCQPADDINAVLGYDLIRSCVASETSIIGKDGNGRQYFGYDFGMTVNPSVMLRLEETKDSKLVVRSYKFMKEKRFANQKRLANMMMDKCHRGSMDAGAQGSQLAQELEEEYGDKFEGVMLTGSTMRAELANLVWRFFDEGRIVIPDNDDIIEHLFAIKKEEREGSQPKIYSEATSNKDDHADFFWALALALYSHGGYVSNEIGIRRLPNAMRRDPCSQFMSSFY